MIRTSTWLFRKRKFQHFPPQKEIRFKERCLGIICGRDCCTEQRMRHQPGRSTVATKRFKKKTRRISATRGPQGSRSHRRPTVAPRPQWHFWKDFRSWSENMREDLLWKPLFSQKKWQVYTLRQTNKSPSKIPVFFRYFHTIQVWHLSQKFCQCWPIRSCWSPFFTRRARALSKDTPRVEHDLVAHTQWGIEE